MVRIHLAILVISHFFMACSFHQATASSKICQGKVTGKDKAHSPDCRNQSPATSSGGSLKGLPTNGVIEMEIYSSRVPRPDRYKVGNIRVIDNKKIELLSSSGEKAEKLKRTIAELSAKEEILLDGENMAKNDDGDVVLAHTSMLVKKGDPQFVLAVKSELSDRGFGCEIISTNPTKAQHSE